MSFLQRHRQGMRDMKALPIPVKALRRIKIAYDALMVDDLPIDFDKVSELIQAAGVVVRVVEVKHAEHLVDHVANG
jgi:hypothetical protein